MTASKVWIIEPRDPFIARDGKPFGVGASANTLPFPFPSTTTGGLRTRSGIANGSFVDGDGKPNTALITKVKEIAACGGLLVELDEHDEIDNWYMHAPADALLLEDKTDKRRAQIKRLVPLNVEGGVTNLQQPPHDKDHLAPVGLSQFNPNKPFDRSPRFWRWEKFKQWLLEPEELTGPIDTKDLGNNGPLIEARTHVAIDQNTWTSDEGKLFQTRGLEFTRCSGKKLREAKRLALAVCVVDNPLANKMGSGFAPLGGERRIVAWRKSDKQLPRECLNQIQDRVAKDKCCRVVLLAPAYFTQGSRPSWLLSQQHNIKVELQAIACGRMQVISGWDFEHYAIKNGRTVRGQPKPTRRLVPAGSVYFLKLNGDDAAIKILVEKAWMNCISDDEQNRRDGFGLAAIGVWDGTVQPMTFDKEEKKGDSQ